MVKIWIEAMRLRTLPVSVAGVILAAAYAVLADTFRLPEFLACLSFAILCQIASNFANEYFDFRAGLDRPGREGPRRGVTEGDISPRAMLMATAVTLALAAAIGLTLVVRGGWWLIALGALIFIGAMAYSTGPYPLSRHGLGEVTVVFFFGIIPVNLTFYVMSLAWDVDVMLGSLALGLMGANVLIVNNYRDREDDLAVGKHTLAVLLGLRPMGWLYLLNGFVAIALTVPLWALLPLWSWLIPAAYLVCHTILYWRLTSRYGRSLNPLLGMTAMLMLAWSLGVLIVSLII